MLRIRWALVVVGFVILVCGACLDMGVRAAHAQNRLAQFGLFKQVDADPTSAYPVAQNNGPWMIMAATFSSRAAREVRDPAENQRLRQEAEAQAQEAMAQAQELVHELRRDYKLQAYTFVRKTELEGPVQGRGINPQGRPRRMVLNSLPSLQEVAVVVGNYSAVDSPEAERDLRLIKFIEPNSLKLSELQRKGRRTYQQLVAFRLSQKNVTADAFIKENSSSFPQGVKKNVQISNSTREHGPMGSAFVTRNPMLPQDDFQAPIMDKTVYEMNKEVGQHSLLRCSGRYTVKVATFTGAVIMDQKKIRELEKGRLPLDSRLAEAAQKAHELTEALRVKGYEAYEFHDRQTSIVTVGSFHSAGTPRPDGKIEMDPLMLRTVRAFGPDPITGKPRIIMQQPLDLSPTPIVVPQRSVSADYASGGLFGWR